MGVVTEQMAQIACVTRPNATWQPLRHKAYVFHVLAIVVLLVGAYRFFCEQAAISGRGTRAGPWSMILVGATLLGCLIAVLLLLVFHL